MLPSIEARRRGGQNRNAQLTAEERKAIMRKVRLAAAVKAVAERTSELSPEQYEKLRAIFGGAR